MPQSMTGFGSSEVEIAPFGKICVELRSTNHKFLEVVFHLPEGFLAFEERIKNEIESRVKRGRLICHVQLVGGKSLGVLVNRELLKKYHAALREIKATLHIKGEVGLDTLLHLPGVISLPENKISHAKVWPKLKVIVGEAVKDLAKTRTKEGRALEGFLKNKTRTLSTDLTRVKARFKKALKERLKAYDTDEERGSFMRNSDITEELERLSFHIQSFQSKLSRDGSIGKELDFIAQEMQREANTIAAKTFDTFISGRLVEIKSQIEKMREQVQNIE